MLNWLTGKKPDHPMYNVAEAQKLLADLPVEAGKALEEIAASLHGITATEGFALVDRIGVVKLLDETGQEHEKNALADFLRGAALKEHERRRLWEVLLEFWENLSAAYRLCLQEMAQATKPGATPHPERALLVARALRAIANQEKLVHLRYLPVKPAVWRALGELYGFAEKEKITGEVLKAYVTDLLPTNLRQELLRSLMLEVSAPESLRLEEVELSARIIARLASGFSLHANREEGGNFCFDLARPAEPARASPQAAAAPTLRYFGIGRNAAEIRQIIDRHTEHPEEPEKRFGDDFSVHDKLVVLKRLLAYWGDAPPRRQGPRVPINTSIKLAPGFQAASELVTRVEISGMAEVTEKMRMKVKKERQDGLALEAQQASAVVYDWVERDAGAWGLGMEVPRKDESWARIGTLCTFQPAGLKHWWVGVIRRLHRDAQDRENAGITVLAKKPMSVYLRGIGEGSQRADNWASSSGSYEFTYVNAVLLGETAGSATRQEMLLPRDTFTPGLMYEVMVGEKAPHVKLEELLDRGEDYDHVRVTWLKGAA
jgi:hypothetical protein